MSEKFEITDLNVQVKGEITANNLPEFRAQALAAIAGINRDLKTDEDFGQAELDVKALKAAESSIRQATLNIFTDELKKLSDGVLAVAEEFRVPRLEMEKLIATEKVKVISALIEKHLANFDINPRLARSNYLPSLQAAVKFKRTLESMDAALADCVAERQKEIHECRAIISKFEAFQGADLISDRESLELCVSLSVSAELRRRLDSKIARDAAAAAKVAADAEISAMKAQDVPAQVSVVTPPPGPEIDPPAETERDEMIRLRGLIVTAFTPVKFARDNLKYERNISKLHIFGIALAELFAKELS